MTQNSALKILRLQTDALNWGSCARTFAARLYHIPSVTAASVSFSTEQLNMSYEPQQIRLTIRDRTANLGYTIKKVNSITAFGTYSAES